MNTFGHPESEQLVEHIQNNATKKLAELIRAEKSGFFSTPNNTGELMEMIERDFGKNTEAAANVVRIVMFTQNLALESAALIAEKA